MMKARFFANRARSDKAGRIGWTDIKKAPGN
ncbi:hypothetical protein EPYR_01217 [Erwinia pyrifoliae DSM 12163]|nr:hypothetical protein EPYR_01217 [Erwinia pyrifoliae DSM 12163]